jgi:hypothetical protein
MDSKRIEQIYDQISSFTLDLEDDPTALGQRYIQQKVAQCRRFLNLTSNIMLEIQREIRESSSKLRAAKAAFELASDNLRATDQRVIRLPHVDDRTATINVLLATERDTMLILEREIEDLKIVEKAVKHRYDELKGTNTDIRTQRATLRDELDTGAFYGDETDKPQKRRNTLAEDELDKIMSGDWNPTSATETVESSFEELTAGPVPTSAPVKGESPSDSAVTPVTPPLSEAAQQADTSGYAQEMEPAEAAKVVSELDELEYFVDKVLASTTSVPVVESIKVEIPTQSASEFEGFMKMKLPTSVPVSVREAPAGAVSDDDYSDIFASL